MSAEIQRFIPEVFDPLELPEYPLVVADGFRHKVPIAFVDISLFKDVSMSSVIQETVKTLRFGQFTVGSLSNHKDRDTALKEAQQYGLHGVVIFDQGKQVATSVPKVELDRHWIDDDAFSESGWKEDIQDNISGLNKLNKELVKYTSWYGIDGVLPVALVNGATPSTVQNEVVDLGGKIIHASPEDVGMPLTVPQVIQEIGAWIKEYREVTSW